MSSETGGRPLKEFRYKSIGGSLAMYRRGVYVRSIPHETLYHLLREMGRIGKAGVLAKLRLLNEGAAKVGSGKEPEKPGGGASP